MHFTTLIGLMIIGFYSILITTGTVGDTLTLGEEFMMPPIIPIGIIIFLLVVLYHLGIDELTKQDEQDRKQD